MTSLQCYTEVLFNLLQIPIIKISKQHLTQIYRINRLVVKPSPITRNNHHKQKISGHNDDVSHRTNCKVGHIDQNVGDRTRHKLQDICNSTNKGVFFPFYDSIIVNGQENFKI
jgi:hypothetical protein